MARPKKRRRVSFSPSVTLFLPYGKSRFLHEAVALSLEEVEAIRLKNIKKLDQVQAAKVMHTSQSTFQRILASAYQKIARGLIYGLGIRIKS